MRITLLVVLLSLSIFAAEPTQAQPTAGKTASGGSQGTTSGSGGIDPFLFETFKALVVPAGAALVAAVSAFLVGLTRGERMGAVRTLERFRPKKSVRNPIDFSFLVVGVARSGKSVLVTRVSKPLNGEKVLTTTSFSIVEFTDNHNSKAVRFIATDYQGENFAQLVSSFIQEQQNPDSLLRYGSIDAVVLVVDLYRDDEEEDAQYPIIDQERVDFQLAEWNKTALDAVFGMLTQESLKVFCLFVTKFDKLNNGRTRQENIEYVRGLYSPLLQEINERVQGYADARMIVGAPYRGDGLTGGDGLLPMLFRYATQGEKREREKSN